MRIFGKEVRLKLAYISFLLFSFFVMQLFAQSFNDQSIQLSAAEKKWIAEHPVIKVGMDPNYAPYEWIDNGGQPKGMVVDYMRIFERKLGLHFEIIKDKSWDELLNMAKKGELDLLTSIVNTPERSFYLSFSQPYRDTYTIIIDNGDNSYIGSLSKLSNKLVAVEKGYFMEELLKNNYPEITLVSAQNTTQALRMVLDGVADAYVGDVNVADYVIKKNHFYSLRFSGQTEHISQHSFALSKGNEPLAAILTKAMATIPKNESDAMFSHWFNIDRGINSEMLIKYAVAIVLILMLIGYWVYLLKREIRYRKNAEENLRVSEELYRNIAENMVDVVWKTDKNYYFTYISPSVEKSLGFPPKELIGHHVFELFTEEGIATCAERMRQRKEDEKQGIHDVYSTLEIQHKCKDGSLIWGEIIANPHFDDELNVISYHGISRVITERKEMQDKIQELAFYDPLTDLANRRLLEDRLKQTLSSSKRSKKYAAIIYIDLDNFKPLNDSYGHSMGDLLLVDAAKRLKSCVRTMDTVARVGGDEFALIIHELDENGEKSTQEVTLIAEKILAILSTPYLLKPYADNHLAIEHKCTASIGVLIFKAGSDSEELLFDQADCAMYQAKQDGGNTIRFYNRCCAELSA